MAQNLGNFLTNREHAPQGYIYPCVNLPKDLEWLGKKDRTKKKSAHLENLPPFWPSSVRIVFYLKKEIFSYGRFTLFQFQFEHAPGLFSEERFILFFVS
jgi:hypothetical protein